MFSSQNYILLLWYNKFEFCLCNIFTSLQNTWEDKSGIVFLTQFLQHFVIQIVRRYNISDAVAYLLEKAGDIQGAFGIMRESLQMKIKGIEEAAAKQESGEGMTHSPFSLFMKSEPCLADKGITCLTPLHTAVSSMTPIQAATSYSFCCNTTTTMLDNINLFHFKYVTQRH